MCLDARRRDLILVLAVAGRDDGVPWLFIRAIELLGDKILGRWSWELLGSVVQGVIDRGGIGRPAALRLTVHVRGGEAEARQLQVETEGLAATWFGGKPDSAYAIGGSGGSSGPVPGENSERPTVTALKWPRGESAILSVSAGAQGSTGGNVMLMGLRGSLYHEIGPSDFDDPESWSE